MFKMAPQAVTQALPLRRKSGALVDCGNGASKHKEQGHANHGASRDVYKIHTSKGCIKRSKKSNFRQINTAGSISKGTN